MTDQSRQWTAALVIIGDEILSGRTQDRNVAQVATWLNEQGITPANFYYEKFSPSGAVTAIGEAHRAAA